MWQNVSKCTKLLLCDTPARLFVTSLEYYSSTHNYSQYMSNSLQLHWCRSLYVKTAFILRQCMKKMRGNYVLERPKRTTTLSVYSTHTQTVQSTNFFIFKRAYVSLLVRPFECICVLWSPTSLSFWCAMYLM